MAAGQGFKALEVLREVPEEGIATADEAILVVGDDEGEHSGRIELNSHRPRDMRMGIVAVQTHVIVREVKQGGDLWIEPKARESTWLAANLKFDLVEMVTINMRVAQGVHKVPNLKA